MHRPITPRRVLVPGTVGTACLALTATAIPVPAAQANVIGLREVPVVQRLPGAGSNAFVTGWIINMTGGATISWPPDNSVVVQGFAFNGVESTTEAELTTFRGGGGTSSGGLGGFRSAGGTPVDDVFAEAVAEVDGFVRHIGGGGPYLGPGSDYFEQFEFVLTIRGRSRIVSVNDDVTVNLGTNGYVDLPYQLVFPQDAIVEIEPIGGPWPIVDGPLNNLGGVSMSASHEIFVWDNAELAEVTGGLGMWDPEDFSEFNFSESAVPLVTELWRFRASDAQITAQLTGRGEVLYEAETSIRVRITVPEPGAALAGLAMGSLLLGRRRGARGCRV